MMPTLESLALPIPSCLTRFESIGRFLLSLLDFSPDLLRPRAVFRPSFGPSASLRRRWEDRDQGSASTRSTWTLWTCRLRFWNSPQGLQRAKNDSFLPSNPFSIWSRLVFHVLSNFNFIVTDGNLLCWPIKVFAFLIIPTVEVHFTLKASDGCQPFIQNDFSIVRPDRWRLDLLNSV